MAVAKLVTSATRIDPADLPPVMEKHRLAAFESFHWKGITYEAAIRDALRFKLIQARAAQLRTREHMRTVTPSERIVRRCKPLPGGGQEWVTQRVPGRAGAGQGGLIDNDEDDINSQKEQGA